jgi:hypothetical protein
MSQEKLGSFPREIRGERKSKLSPSSPTMVNLRSALLPRRGAFPEAGEGRGKRIRWPNTVSSPTPRRMK